MPGTEEPLPGTPQQRLIRYFESVNMIFGKSRAEIIANLGTPKQISTEKELSRAKKLSPEDRRLIEGHDSETKNKIIESVYAGLSIRTLKVNSPPYREFVYDVTVTSNRYKMPWNLNVGSLHKDVRRILGNPARSADNREIYEVVYFDDKGHPIGYIDHITFSFHGNTVSRIRWQMHLD